MKSITSFLLLFLLLNCTLQAQVTEQDSLALVAFYHATGGDQWTNNTNWLKPGKNVSTWYGIDLTADRVNHIFMEDNNLTGQLPEELGNLTSMTLLSLPSNHLSGTIPSSLTTLPKLLFLGLPDNDYTGEIPAALFQRSYTGLGYPYIVILSQNKFTGISAWDGDYKFIRDLWVENNQLDFGAIESLLKESIPFIQYSPQGKIYSKDNVTLREGATLILKTATGGSANHYQWRKDESIIPEGTHDNYTFKPSRASEGVYTAEVTSDRVADLTLERHPITLRVKEDTVYISCDRSAITLNAKVSDPQATYVWSNGRTTPDNTVTVSGKYGVRIETPNYIIEDTLDVVIPAALSLGNDVDTCTPTVQLSPQVTDADSYQWQTPQGETGDKMILTASVPGRYILKTITSGCEQKDTVMVTLNHFTTGDFIMTVGGTELSNDNLLLNHVAISFTNTTGTGSDFNWSFGDNTTSSEQNPSHTYTKAGQYVVSLHGTDSRGCPITAEKTMDVKDLVITTAITPDGDGKNDKLYVEPFLYQAAFKVLNRWGQVVYETSSYQDDFTGTQLESGIYYYELHFKEIDKRFKGYVHILK